MKIRCKRCEAEWYDNADDCNDGCPYCGDLEIIYVHEVDDDDEPKPLTDIFHE